MKPLSHSAARIAGKSFERKYVALGRIVKAWAQIVGTDLASKAQPVKINYRKRERGKANEARLDIAVNSADATILHYQKDLILERINQVFGERWVTDIRFVHVPTDSTVLKPSSARQHPGLSDQEQETLQGVLGGMLQDVEDADIRERLKTLGTSVITKEYQ